MVFSSLLFLFGFLPAVLLLYAVVPRRAHNLVLLVASLLFYGWGESRWWPLMLASISVNWGAALLVERWRNRRAGKAALVAAIAVNLGLLGVFKYAGFLARNANLLLEAVGLTTRLEVPALPLPLGISFFTFHALSYVIDIHRAEERAERSPPRVALFISLFPQLVAGPILRYRDVAQQIRERRATLDRMASGVRRFVMGLAKKVLIANTMATVADQVFDAGPGTITTGAAWLGLAAYTMQIYFDFSGYSDMAIGLGRMFGFEFRENFAHPYASRSMTDFWRRWHISLSSWFRDYLYIPLGGNRRGPARTAFNLGLVFLLCGLWHGASWNFVIWGALHGGFLALERGVQRRGPGRAPAALGHVYTLAVVMLGWVFFRAVDLPRALAFLGALVGAGVPDPVAAVVSAGPLVNATFIAAGCAAVLAAGPLLSRLEEILSHRPALAARFDVLAVAATFLLFALATASLAAGTHNPFIYFRF